MIDMASKKRAVASRLVAFVAGLLLSAGAMAAGGGNL